MNTTPKTRFAQIAQIVGSATASVLITFTALSLIANYALPGPVPSSATLLMATAASPTR